jgi:hypothetical protein
LPTGEPLRFGITQNDRYLVSGDDYEIELAKSNSLKISFGLPKLIPHAQERALTSGV